MPTIRAGAPAGEDGASITITTPAGEPPGLSDVGERLKHNRRVWSALDDTLTSDPATYAGDRFTNDRMPIKGHSGPPRGTGFGGGYHGRLKTRPAARRVSITSSRPFVPHLTSAVLDDIVIEALERWWLDDEA